MENYKMFLAKLLATLFLVIPTVLGHGRMLDPPNRSSMWRYGFDVEPNYTDNQLFCGGMDVQYNQNGGKCGICGDNFADPAPRENEDGGRYGKGIVVKTYQPGSQAPIFVELTQEHMGYFEFHLCDLSLGPESDECFQTVPLDTGATQYKVEGSGRFVNHTMTLQLPQVKCERCVLRWHYRAGNNRGQCDDGTWALGCGDQEIFRGCADIALQ